MMRLYNFKYFNIKFAIGLLGTSRIMQSPLETVREWLHDMMQTAFVWNCIHIRLELFDYNDDLNFHFEFRWKLQRLRTWIRLQCFRIYPQVPVFSDIPMDHDTKTWYFLRYQIKKAPNQFRDFEQAQFDAFAPSTNGQPKFSEIFAEIWLAATRIGKY